MMILVQGIVSLMHHFTSPYTGPGSCFVASHPLSPRQKVTLTHIKHSLSYVHTSIGQYSYFAI